MSEITEFRSVQEFPCYYDLYDPGVKKHKPLIIALHGYGGDKTSMMKLMRRINERDYLIAALQGPHQHMIMPAGESRKPDYGFGWLTNFKPEESVAIHHRLVREIIEGLTSSGEADPDRIFLLGFSQAAAVNFRFAFTQNDLIKGVVAICGGVPGDWQIDGKYKKSNIDVLYIATERDEFYTPDRMRQNAEALRRCARSVELRFFDATHEVPREAYPVIDNWLAQV